MKKILSGTLLVIGLLVSQANASVDLTTSSTNTMFSNTISSLGLGTCKPNTYRAYVSADDDGSSYEDTIEEDRKIMMDIYKESTGSTYVKTKQVGSNVFVDLMKLKESGSLYVRSTTYVSGYGIIESCLLK